MISRTMLIMLTFLFLMPVHVFGQYAGTYSIGSAGHFTTIAAAFDSLETYGINGPVVLELTDAAYSAGGRRISYIPGTSDIQTVTLKPAAGVFPEITYTVLSGDSAAFLFRGARYVTIDGSNNGTDSRDLTMTVTSSLTVFNAIYIMGSRYITVKNCIIHMPQTGTSVSTGAVRLYYNTGNTQSLSSDIVIENNRMMGGGACVYSFSTSGLGNHENLYILNNEMGNAAPGDSIQNGIYSAYNTNIQVKGNRISVHNRSATVRGIYFGSGTRDAVAEGNEIEVFVDQQTTNAYGIHVTNSSAGNGTKLFNNWIKGLRNVIPTTGASGHEHAIRIENTPAGTTDTVAFNSIYIDGTSAKNTNVFAVMINNSAGDGNAVVMNNIIQMTGLRGTTGSIVGIARLSTYTGLQSNYNDIWLDSTGASTRRMVGAFHTGGTTVTSPYYTLAEWQAVSSGDANSHSVNPHFVSLVDGEVDLHLTDSTALQSPEILDAAAWLGATFAYDKDDVARSATPDIGSVEFEGPGGPPSPVHLLSPPDGIRYVTHPAGYEEVTFSWTRAIDPDGDEITYYIQVDTSTSFLLGFGENENDTAFTVYTADLDWLAKDLGVTPGDSVVLFWRILSYDMTGETASLDTFAIHVVREVTGGTFYAVVTGQHEVPPVYDDSEAEGAFALTADSTALHFIVYVYDLPSPVTGAHIHVGAPGVNGAAVRTLAFGENMAGGTWTAADGEPFTPGRLNELLQGLLYVNLHTDDYPGGHIRGQVVGDPYSYLNEPYNLTASSGDGYVHLDWNSPDEGDVTKPTSARPFRRRPGSTAGDGPALTGYNVYRSENDTTWNMVAHIDTTSLWLDSSVTIGHVYSYFVTAIYDIGQSHRTDVVDISPVVGIGHGDRPLKFTLYQNHPNPFNPASTIRFDLAEPAATKLEIFNVLGQRVKTLVNQNLGAGEHTVSWRGEDDLGRKVASGVYMYRLQSGSHTTVRKMMLVK